MRKQSAGNLKVKEGDGGREKGGISDREACSTVCLWAFQPAAVKRGFEWSYQFLS